MTLNDIASKMCAELGHIWSERTPYGRRCLWCGCKEVKWWKALFTKAGRAWLAEKEKQCGVSEDRIEQARRKV